MASHLSQKSYLPVLGCSPRVFPGVATTLALEYVNTLVFLVPTPPLPLPEEKAAFEQDSWTDNVLAWEQVARKGSIYSYWTEP